MVIVACACALAASTALAAPGHRAVSAGTTVAASISSGQNARALRVTITRNGAVVYAAHIRSRSCGSFCMFTSVAPGRKALRLVDLDGDGEPEVVIGLYSGGAHCCFIDQVFRYDAARGTYVKAEHDFLDAGATLKPARDGYDFVSADARFAENGFTDYADSGAPLQIWRFDGKRFVDITRRFPNQIRRDAARWLKAFNRHIANGAGFIAAWAGDEYLLGKRKKTDATLASEVRRGRLHSTLGLPHNSPQRFVADLEKFLRRLGYAKP